MRDQLLPLGWLLAATTTLFAQDGQQLYSLYCSACHGADGKGATGGAFPPLAESPWIAGEPDRAIKIVLKGLGGPVDVLGKTYNLEMPPQGAVLPDEQIAAILTYARSAWGNQSGAVSTDLVKTIRAATDDRKSSWTAEEILKLHPLPLEKSAFRNLISRTYSGKWSSLPDFSQLKAENVEEEHDGLLDLDDATLKDDFAMVWQGDFEAPVTGEYEFLLDADDAAAVTIAGKTVVEVRGAGPMDGTRAKQGKATLTLGKVPLRVEYLELSGNNGIALGWKGPGDKGWKWLSKSTAKTPKFREYIDIKPVDGRPVIYRNFIAGTTSRAIGVGFPGGLNLAYSADNLAPELLWTGKFIDGGAKWIDRGTDYSPPAGDHLIQLGKQRYLPTEARFRGYKLDPAGNPSFSAQIGDRILLDSWHAETGVLVRKLTLGGDGPPLEIRVSGNLPGDFSIESRDASLKTQNGASSLDLAPGRPATVTYRWK